jgi:hypothetical protein
MQIRKILFSQAIRLFDTTGRTAGGLYGRKLFSAFEDRYGFLQGPRTVPEYDPAKGIHFLHGFFEDRVVIDKVSIFNDGMVCETKGTTDDADAFIDDAIEWGRQTAGLDPDRSAELGRAYLSRLEVHADVALADTFKQFSNFGHSIAETVRSYGQNTNDFEVSLIGLHNDLTKMPAPKPLAFTFDRRDGEAYDAGVYFAVAPMRTADHLAHLDALEKLLTTD